MMIVLIILGITALVVVLSFILIPFMATFNHATEESYKADEKQFVQGVLTVGIKNKKATGEVSYTSTMNALATKPAKIYDVGENTPSALEKGDKVLIVEIRGGIAFVAPRGIDFLAEFNK
jgi:hypothetical protein